MSAAKNQAQNAQPALNDSEDSATANPGAEGNQARKSSSDSKVYTPMDTPCSETPTRTATAACAATPSAASASKEVQVEAKRDRRRAVVVRACVGACERRRPDRTMTGEYRRRESAMEAGQSPCRCGDVTCSTGRVNAPST